VKLPAVAFLLAVALLVTAGCSRVVAPDPECVTLVEKILRCDPTAPPWMRSDPAKFCPPNRRSCAAKDVSTPAGCGQLMACLYDGD
jgi:hypothetical protein